MGPPSQAVYLSMNAPRIQVNMAAQGFYFNRCPPFEILEAMSKPPSGEVWSGICRIRMEMDGQFVQGKRRSIRAEP
jgi:hypothetical protein